MTSRGADRRSGEFELIAKYFAPLARDAPGALGLADDVAILTPPVGRDLVLKTDSLIEGVHFLRDDPANTVGRKALRRALSDLAAKGAEPIVYLLALALPEWPDESWLEAFASGLASDQAEFGIALVGGETNATPGPLTLTVTAIGHVPQGALIRRDGANIGDCVFVTGTVGDSGAGLELAKGIATFAGEANREFLLSRYRLPLPRLAFGHALRSVASASIDVSDGLLADLGHIADASKVRVEIRAVQLPMSRPLLGAWGEDGGAGAQAATAGDDYEIAFTAPASHRESVFEVGRRTATAVTPIGHVVAGTGVALLDAHDRDIPVVLKGYAHF